MTETASPNAESTSTVAESDSTTAESASPSSESASPAVGSMFLVSNRPPSAAGSASVRATVREGRGAAVKEANALEDSFASRLG